LEKKPLGRPRTELHNKFKTNITELWFKVTDVWNEKKTVSTIKC